MDKRDIYAGLLREISTLPVIDCHEHLKSEVEFLAGPNDVFSLFRHYCMWDLESAGMSVELANKLVFSDADLDWKWKQFKPYYDRCRHTSYFRSVEFALGKFYGEHELNDGNIQSLSDKIRAFRTPDLYARVLDACGIQTVLNCDGALGDTMGGRIRQCRRALVCEDGDVGHPSWSKPARDIVAEGLGGVQTLDDVDAVLEKYVAEAAEGGAYCIKFMTRDLHRVKPEAAAAELKRLHADPQWNPTRLPELASYTATRQVKLATQYDLPCCMHTGYWDDYREYSPETMLELLPQVPDARFDVYHVGYPHVRSAIMLGKAWPNVYMSMAWTYIISQRFAHDALDEMLEMVPVNKIFAFGGDYCVPEKIWGHLTMAREVVSSVLADKVCAGRMTTGRALDIAAMLFYDNPKAFYNL